MDKIIAQLDGGTLEERIKASKEFLGLTDEQSFQDLDIDDGDAEQD